MVKRKEVAKSIAQNIKDEVSRRFHELPDMRYSTTIVSVLVDVMKEFDELENMSNSEHLAELLRLAYEERKFQVENSTQIVV